MSRIMYPVIAKNRGFHRGNETFRLNIFPTLGLTNNITNKETLSLCFYKCVVHFCKSFMAGNTSLKCINRIAIYENIFLQI